MYQINMYIETSIRGVKKNNRVVRLSAGMAGQSRNAAYSFPLPI